MVHIPVKTTRALGRVGLLFKKHAPEILIGVGVISVVGVAATAIRATLKVNEVLDHHEQKIDVINEAEGLDEKTIAKETAKVWATTSGEMFALYLPTLTFGVLACTSFMTSHKIMKNRQLAMVAAYKVMEYSYDQYREAIRKEHGEEYDRDISDRVAQASHQKVVQTTDEDGNVQEVVIKQDDPEAISVYARFFDETCPAWEPNPEYNMLFLQQQQSYWNDMLRSRGHVFLNEVYKGLGIPHSQAGAVCGWVLNKDDESDNYIDFGIFRVGNERSRAFVNGHENSILLDFNVQGLIYNLI